MDSAPLNMAHFHERRADRHLRRNRFDEAIKAMEMAMAYIEDAYKIVRIPQAIQVLDAQKWDCTRKLKQINTRQQQHERLKHHSFMPLLDLPAVESRHTESPENTAISIHKAIEEFNAKYIESIYEGVNATTNNNQLEESTNWMEDLESRELPVLAPLELPSFELDNNESFGTEEEIE